MKVYSLEARRDSNGVLLDQIWCRDDENELEMRRALLARVRSTVDGGVTITRINPLPNIGEVTDQTEISSLGKLLRTVRIFQFRVDMFGEEFRATTTLSQSRLSLSLAEAIDEAIHLHIEKQTALKAQQGERK